MTFQSPRCRHVVNKSLPVERRVRLIAFLLCGLVYFAGLVLVFQCLENGSEPNFVSVRAVKMSFAQVELQAEPRPMPEPEPRPEPDVMPEPEEEADVALEEVPEEPKREVQSKPEPLLNPEAPTANVTQEAAAPTPAVSAETVQGWVLEQLEKVKYYPPMAEKFNFRGTYELEIVVGADGTIRSADVLGGRGHRILREAMEKMMRRLVGLNFGRPIGEAQELGFYFEFE